MTEQADHFHLSPEEVERQLEIDERYLVEQLGFASTEEEIAQRRLRLIQGDIGFDLDQTDEEGTRELMSRKAEILTPIRPYMDAEEYFLDRIRAVDIAIETSIIRRTFGRFLEITGMKPKVPPKTHQFNEELPKN